jgi:hypothetical protein
MPSAVGCLSALGRCLEMHLRVHFSVFVFVSEGEQTPPTLPAHAFFFSVFFLVA